MTTRSTVAKFAAAGLATTLMLAAASPSYAWSGRHHTARHAAAIGGFAAGALVGAAAANAATPYGYYGPYSYGSYAYSPGYAYGVRSYSAYAYAPERRYAPGISAYAYAPTAAYVGANAPLGTNFAGQPITPNELGPVCSLGMKYAEEC